MLATIDAKMGGGKALLYGFEEFRILIGRRRAVHRIRTVVRKFPYSDRAFFQVFLIALFTTCNIIINEIHVLLICLKTLCVKNKVLSCSTSN